MHSTLFCWQIRILEKLEESENEAVLDFATLVEIVISQSNYHSWKRCARYKYLVIQYKTVTNTGHYYYFQESDRCSIDGIPGECHSIFCSLYQPQSQGGALITASEL